MGRMQDCEVKIDDNLLSKYQSTIKYIPNSGWTLFDGYNGMGTITDELYNLLQYAYNEQRGFEPAYK